MPARPLPALALPALLAATLAFATADPQPPDRKAEEAARKLMKELVAHAGPIPGIEWADFRLVVVDDIGGERHAAAAGWYDWADGKRTPHVKVTRGYVALVREEPNGLALVLARELGRLAVDAGRKPAAHSTIGWAVAAALRELEADRFAVRLVLRSGYSPRGGLRSLSKGRDGFPAGIWPPDDPSRKRLTALLDDPSGTLWREMPVFEIGLLLLRLHDVRAEALVDQVTRDFPDCHEAWALIGITSLFSYWDELGPDPQAGRVLGPVYQTRLHGTVRGRAYLLFWAKAVEALKKADNLKPNQWAVMANLGLAHLLHPDGMKDGRPGAEKYLTAALQALREEKEANPAAEAALLVNLGVVDLAADRRAEARRRFDEAAALAAKLPAGEKAEVLRAVAFNRGLAAVSEGRHADAAKLFTTYLESTPRSDAWWNPAHDHYTSACTAIKAEPLPRDRFKPVQARRKAAVVLPGRRTVTPEEDLDEVQNKLGNPKLRTTPRIVTGVDLLVRLGFSEHGIEVIGYEDEVIAVAVVGPKGRAVVVRSAGPAGELRVGMTRKDVEALPGGTAYAFQPFAPGGNKLAYFPAGGVAVVYDRDGPDGVVAAVLVGPVPEAGR
jgi:hypothetical protein